MGGIKLEKSVLSEAQLEQEYGIKRQQQVYFRSKLYMPYCKVGKLVFYERRAVDKWILSHNVDHKEKMMEK